MKKNKEKESGAVYTPKHIVQMMINGYSGPWMLDKHIIDNSCGEGAFLTEIVSDYITWWKVNEFAGNPKNIAGTIYDNLETYIHGIEIDGRAAERCIENLNNILSKNDLTEREVNWDIKIENALECHDYDGKMDIVVGNPPYVRIHNIKGNEELYNSLKDYSFTKSGSTDLYLAFYELGLRMLNEHGTLIYISPSGWMKGQAGKEFRKYILEHRNLYSIADFASSKVFDGISTYVGIFTFRNDIKDWEKGWIYVSEAELSVLRSTLWNTTGMRYEDAFIGDELYISNSPVLKEIIEYHGKNVVTVKNGLATLSDDVFINHLPDNVELSIDVVKASTGQWGKCLFPYTSDGENGVTPFALEKIRAYFPNTYGYIMSNEETLKNRTYDKGSNWWEIGRSQGLPDTFKYKISLSNLISKPGDVKMKEVKPGQHVYSGYYVTGYKSFEEIKNALDSKDFFEYVKLLKKYKSGNYYTFSSKDVEKFLNYWLTMREPR